MSQPRAHYRKDRRERAEFGALPDDLYIKAEPWPRAGRPVKHGLDAWRVIDDWPERVPVTDAEIDVFEAWFGDILDELFGAS
ncbi:MAG: hypothetical protein WCC64_04955 [Aliidongia sp.]